MKHQKFMNFLLILIFLFDNNSLQACSRVYLNENRTKVVVRTMDLNVDEKPQVIILHAGILKKGAVLENPIYWRSKNESVAITAFDSALSDGMNEKGLAAHLLYFEGTQYEERDHRPALTIAQWIEFILDNFGTVQEVVDHCDNFQIQPTKVAGLDWPLHLALEDASGDSAVFEYIDGKLRIFHGAHYQVVTNEPSMDRQICHLSQYKCFGGNRPLPKEKDSISRFVSLSALLKHYRKSMNCEDPMTHAFSFVMACQIHRDKSSWPTRWISIADLTNKVYYFDRAPVDLR